MRMFDDRGFEAVTMDDIADAGGVSRRTLFRYFPSKNDLVWGGTEEALERLNAGLEQTSPGEPLFDAIRRAYTAAMTFPPDAIEVTRRRLLLIRANPALWAYGMPRFAGIRQTLASFVAEREGIETTGLRAQLAVDVVISVASRALTWWAAQSDEEPQVVLDRALRELQDGLWD